MSESAERLEPCHHCGGEVSHEQHGWTTWIVHCSKCGMQCYWTASQAESVKKWNRRATAEAGDARARGRAPGQVEAQQGIAGDSGAFDHHPSIGPAPGWNLVPIEPTTDMIVAGINANIPLTCDAGSAMAKAYRAMLAAAPLPKQENE